MVECSGCAWRIGVAIALFALAVDKVAIAQITPDGTLGAESSVVTPINQLRDQIQGGAIRGTNLFHSFGEFNIGAGRAVYFANPTGIENILTRVTGSTRSEILGTLGVSGNANLFLINPNGIVFGSNARLDVRGSFLASTASGFKFANGIEFSATNPQAPPLLTINVPIGLQMGANPGRILVQGAGLRATLPIDEEDVEAAVESQIEFELNFLNSPIGLRVPTGRTLALLGGDVTLEGGLLKAPGGRIEIGSVGGNNLVGINPTNTGFALSYEGIQNFQDIQLLRQSAAFVSGFRGGDIQIQGRRFTQTERSQIRANNFGSESGRNVTIRASESVELIGGAKSEQFPSIVTAFTFGKGDAGTIAIETNQLTIRDGGIVGVATTGEGAGGNLTVRADSIDIIGSPVGESFILPSGLAALTFGEGKSGNITIETGKLSVRDGGAIATATASEGDGGNLTIRASESIEVGGKLSIKNSLFPSIIIAATGDEGKSGDVLIETKQLIVRDGGIVGVGTGGEGNAGTLTVRATNSIELIGGFGTSETFIASSLTAGSIDSIDASLFPFPIETASIGDVGDINIETGRLTIRDGGQVSSATNSAGDAGNITVKAEVIELLGTSLNGKSSSGIGAATKGDGDAGNVTIVTGQLTARQGARVVAAVVGTNSQGNAGNITVQAQEVELIGSSSDGLFASGLAAGTEGKGNGGNVIIDAGRLTLRDGAVVSVSTNNSGKAGNLTVRAQQVELIGTGFSPFAPNNGVIPSFLTAATATADATKSFATGDAGNVTIETEQLSVRDGAAVAVGTILSLGDAGNITIRAERVELIGSSAGGQASSTLTAVTLFSGGKAGNVTIDTGKLVVSDGATVGAGTLFSQGDGGNITVRARESVELIGESSSLTAGTFFSTGIAGKVTIDTGRLLLRGGANVIVSTAFSQGEAGEIAISAKDAVELIAGSRLSATTQNAGKAGDVTVKTGNLTINGSQIIVSSLKSDPLQESLTPEQRQQLEQLRQVLGQLTQVGIRIPLTDLLSLPPGDPGSINIEAGNLRLNNAGALNAASVTGNGGNITVRSQDIQLRRQSQFSAAGSPTGVTKEGSIDINTQSLVLLEASSIITSANDPQGGSNIDIKPRNNLGLALFQSADSIINARGQLNIEGDIQPSNPNIPQIEVVDATSLIADSCAPARQGSSFVVTGRGGIPASPEQPLGGENVLVDLVTLDSNSASVGAGFTNQSAESRNISLNPPLQNQPAQGSDRNEIVEATGWIINEQGQVVLVAAHTASAYNPEIKPINCYVR